jgi:hypothetical protein
MRRWRARPPDRTWSLDVCAASDPIQSLLSYVCHTAQLFPIRNKGAMVLRRLDHVLDFPRCPISRHPCQPIALGPTPTFCRALRAHRGEPTRTVRLPAGSYCLPVQYLATDRIGIAAVPSPTAMLGLPNQHLVSLRRVGLSLSTSYPEPLFEDFPAGGAQDCRTAGREILLTTLS